MHMLQSLFYLTTALHVSGITITQLQEHKTTVTAVSGNGYPLLGYARGQQFCNHWMHSHN